MLEMTQGVASWQGMEIAEAPGPMGAVWQGPLAQQLTDECGRIARHIDLPRSVAPPSEVVVRRGATAYGFFQRYIDFTAGYNDTRPFEVAARYTTSSPLGPFTFGVERAMARHAKRYVAGPAPLLEIGAGNRLVPMGLKDLFGDALHITELAPRYSSTKRGVDRELPAATIDRADLPRSAFELAYSFFGTYYSNRQLVVLQKLADSLKVGGEFFGFMKPNGTNRRLMELVARWPMIFYKGGLELVIEDHYFGTPPIGEPALVVSARKCAESIDVGQLFDQARRADKKGGEHEHLSLVSDPSIRLTLDGPRTALSQAEELLPQLIQQVVRWFCQTYKKNPAQLYYQMTGERLVLQSADEPERETLGMQAIVDDLLSLDGLQKLICGVPLTTMLMRHFYPTAKLTTSENVVDTRCAATESLCEWLSALHQ